MYEVARMIYRKFFNEQFNNVIVDHLAFTNMSVPAWSQLVGIFSIQPVSLRTFLDPETQLKQILYIDLFINSLH